LDTVAIGNINEINPGHLCLLGGDELNKNIIIPSSYQISVRSNCLYCSPEQWQKGQNDKAVLSNGFHNFLCSLPLDILAFMIIRALEWLDGKLRILDQSRLPREQVFTDLDDYTDVVLAIKEMRIRGAPAIGIAAAYGIALGASGIETENKDEFLAQLDQVMQAFGLSTG
jgi:hypothetical protein